jgi:integrase
MVRRKKGLTAIQVQNAKARGFYGDGGGLYIQVSPTGAKSWVFRYKRDGRTRWMGLGSASTFSLAEARERALEQRKVHEDHRDPLDERDAERRQRKLEQAKQVTFAQCVEQYLATHEIAWRNEKHAAQWKMTLTRYCEPLADLSIKDIDTDAVLRTLTPLWNKRTETAKRLRGRIERVLSWAKGRGLRTGENPARWAGHLDEMLASPAKIAKAQHHPALPYTEAGAFMAELRQRDSLSARALEFLILTAARTGEVIGATWAEIDFEEKTWTIPASRMKGGKEHRVPLCDRAIEILKGLPQSGSRVFPLSNMAMLELIRGMRPGYVPHGFRSTFRDWAAERTNVANHVVEQALAHVIGNKVEAAYRRGDLFEKRRRLMNDWGKYCARPSESGIVVLIARQSR